MESNMNGWMPSTTTAEAESLSSEELLVALNAFIEFYASVIVHSHSRDLAEDALYHLRQEVAQNTRIKLWFALQKREIEHLKAYTMSVVYHEYVSIVRQKQRNVQMLT